MKFSIQSVACFLFGFANEASAFQPRLPTKNVYFSSRIRERSHSKLLSRNGPKIVGTRRSLVLAAVHKNDDTSQQYTGQDIDGVRRRQLLFSMLYGSATVMTASSSANAAVAQTETKIGLGGTDVLLANNNDVEITTNDILKPPKDDREYLAYTLDNGLRVLLCSDPSSNEAAACMDVHVGACSDPKEVPGMAHFAGTSTRGICLFSEYSRRLMSLRVAKNSERNA